MRDATKSHHMYQVGIQITLTSNPKRIVDTGLSSVSAEKVLYRLGITLLCGAPANIFRATQYQITCTIKCPERLSASFIKSPPIVKPLSARS